VSLAAQNRAQPGDTLQHWAPRGVVIATSPKGRPIQLADLASHTSGLPREPDFEPIPDRATAVAARWAWLQRQANLAEPGTRAAYSNAAYDLLADALERAAGEPYPAALRRWVTGPLGMVDTTPSPNADQCARLLAPDHRRGDHPCADTAANAGSGGVYSTASDMGLWMKRLLAPDHGGSIGEAAQTILYPRGALRSVNGMDHAGRAAGIGLGWVELEPDVGRPRVLEKTGGGDGFLTYVVLAPEQRIGVFLAVDKVRPQAFHAITRGGNALAGVLAGAAPPAAVQYALNETPQPEAEAEEPEARPAKAAPRPAAKAHAHRSHRRFKA
ncbi:MAG TPA: D-alanyl-D-alanine-carboxypeptidase/endopeptidase AmpH, partial [Caulobacteraceae bacterium]|nr:D-alanyl-D-alanine-carboxypeptidase/endopeptidase AmpH [Caulobacteraceae bacterium]